MIVPIPLPVALSFSRLSAARRRLVADDDLPRVPATEGDLEGLEGDLDVPVAESDLDERRLLDLTEPVECRRRDDDRDSGSIRPLAHPLATLFFFAAEVTSLMADRPRLRLRLRVEPAA